MSTEARNRVVVEIDPSSGDAANVVISGALSLFGPADGVEVVLCLRDVDEPSEPQARRLVELCPTLIADDHVLPDVLLLGAAEALATQPLLHVSAGANPVENARAVILLTALAQVVWGQAPGRPGEADTPAAAGPAPIPAITAPMATAPAATAPAVAPRDVPAPDSPAGRRARALTAIAARDATRAGRRPRIVAVHQHRQYWGALETVCAHLAERDDIDFDIVALDSFLDRRSGTTSAFLAEQGYDPRNVQWLAKHVHEIDVVVFDNPYDNMRPPVAQSEYLALRGVRVAYSPYGHYAAAGEVQRSYMFNLPLHHVAWRIAARSETQRMMFAQSCPVGSDHVLAVGLPKLDRFDAAGPRSGGTEFRRAANGRPIVLWNPHFTVSQQHAERFSTFDRWAKPLLSHFVSHQDRVLLLRPHFRLFHDLRLLGGDWARFEHMVREHVAHYDNILLDESPDYVDAFDAADALLSDLSSLIGEFLLTGRPVLYLHRADSPGYNEDAGYMDELEHVTKWAPIERFLNAVVAGQNPGGAERASLLARHFALNDGKAGERFANHLVSQLVAEWDAVGGLRRAG